MKETEEGDEINECEEGNMEEGEKINVEDIREDSVKLEDMKEIGIEEDIKEVGIDEDTKEITYEEDHTPSLNQDHDHQLEDSLLNDHNVHQLEDHNPLEDQPLSLNDHPLKDHHHNHPLLHTTLPLNQPFLIQDNLKKESKPLNVSSIPSFTEITIKIKSKDLSEGKIVMNGMEIGNFETERVQIVS